MATYLVRQVQGTSILFSFFFPFPLSYFLGSLGTEVKIEENYGKGRKARI